jgi:hypothetical protein
MTELTQAPTAPTLETVSAPDAESPRTPASAIRAAVHRHRWALVVGAIVIVAGVVGALTIPSGTQGALDPGSATGPGSRAVAEVLRAHGVRVDPARSSTEAVTGAGPGSTIVVVDTTLLGPRQLDRLRASRADLVLVEPDLITLGTLAPQVEPAGVTSDRVQTPECSDPDAVAAGVVTAGGQLYRGTTTGTTTTGTGTGSGADGADGADTGGLVACYPHAGDGPTDRWTMLRVTTNGHRVTVLGQSAVLRNETLADAGKAALALRVLGARPQLRWYLPDPAELAESGSAPTLSDLLPTWVAPVIVQLAVVVGVALLWRGRRLGRLVTEPLPVVVRSAETQEGRARLYRQAGARDRAAATLRTAALRRLAVRLSVPSSAQPEDVVRLAAAASGRPESELREIMLGGAPVNDAALVRLATTLDVIEHEVAGNAGTAGRSPHRQGAAQDAAHDPEVETR